MFIIITLLAAAAAALHNREQLTLTHINWVHKIVSQQHIPRYIKPDCILAGCQGLFEAAGTYDGVSSKFTTYSYSFIKGRVLREKSKLSRCLVSHRGILRHYTLKRSAPQPPLPKIHSLTFEAAAAAAPAASTHNFTWAAAAAVLTPSERLLVQRRFGLDGQRTHSWREIAALMDLSTEGVRLRYNTALRKLRGGRPNQYKKCCNKTIIEKC